MPIYLWISPSGGGVYLFPWTTSFNLTSNSNYINTVEFNNNTFTWWLTNPDRYTTNNQHYQLNNEGIYRYIVVG